MQFMYYCNVMFRVKGVSFTDFLISIYRIYLENISFITYLYNVRRNNMGVGIRKDGFI